MSSVEVLQSIQHGILGIRCFKAFIAYDGREH